MANRPHLPTDAETEVLTQSRRRCCMCFCLKGDSNEKKGQVAHLDRNPTNNAIDNLAFLCFEHHNDYDSRMSQAKGFTPTEVKEYRRRLYQHIDEHGVSFPMRPRGQVKCLALVNTRNPRNVIFSVSLTSDSTTTCTDVLLRVKVNREVEDFSPTGMFAVRRLDKREAELTARQPLHPRATVEVCDVILLTNTEADAYGFEIKISVSMTDQPPLDFRHAFTHDDLDFANKQDIIVEFDPVSAGS